ncbi:hypothetical protein [Streptomyces sp. NPDC002156]
MSEFGPGGIRWVLLHWSRSDSGALDGLVDAVQTFGWNATPVAATPTDGA